MDMQDQSCINYDHARAWFLRHKKFVDASPHSNSCPITVVFHGTPERRNYRSIMEGILTNTGRRAVEHHSKRQHLTQTLNLLRPLNAILR